MIDFLINAILVDCCGCRCKVNCKPEVDRGTSLVLVAYCQDNVYDMERFCTGGVQWQLEALSDTTDPLHHRPENWTELAKGGPLFDVSPNELPATNNRTEFEIKASGRYS